MKTNIKYKNKEELELQILSEIISEKFGENFSEYLEDMKHIRVEKYLKEKYEEYANKTFKEEKVTFPYEEWLESVFNKQ